MLYIPNSELEEINQSLLYTLLYQSINSFCDMKSYYHKLTSIFLDLKSFDSQNHIKDFILFEGMKILYCGALNGIDI